MPRSERQAEIFKGGVTVTSAGGAGFSQIESGDSSVTISSNLVASGNPIFLQPWVGASSIGFVQSGAPMALAVDSVVNGVSFAAATVNAEASQVAIPFFYWIMP